MNSKHLQICETFFLRTLYPNVNLSYEQSQKQPPEVFCKKVFLKLSKISQENTCLGAFFMKKWLRHRCFPVKFAKFFKKPFSNNCLYSVREQKGIIKTTSFSNFSKICWIVLLEELKNLVLKQTNNHVLFRIQRINTFQALHQGVLSEFWAFPLGVF